MLNILFDAAIPAVEEHGGEIDRLIGDAVFATFQGEGHPERAARAALALQAAAAPLAAAHPDVAAVSRRRQHGRGERRRARHG